MQLRLLFALSRSRRSFICNSLVASTSPSLWRLRPFSTNPLQDLERSLDEERVQDQLQPNAKGFIESMITRGTYGYQTYVPGGEFLRSSYRTTKKFETEEAVTKQFDKLREMSPAFVLHPLSCKRSEEGGYFLEFPYTILPLRDCLEELGEARSPPSAQIILQILSSVRHCLIYLYQMAKLSAHGSLMEDGLVIRRDMKCFLAQLNIESPSESDPTIDLNDLLSLVTQMLSKIQPNGTDDVYYKRLARYEDFLKKNISKPSKLSSEDHMLFLVNYPVSWSTSETIAFMNNMHTLYHDECLTNPNIEDSHIALKKNPTFTAHMDVIYNDWQTKLRDPVLVKVYENGRPSTRGADIVSFAYNCIKHHLEREIKIHDKLYTLRDGVLEKLQKEFPFLVIDEQEGFYMTVENGYVHPRKDMVTLRDILLGQIRG